MSFTFTEEVAGAEVVEGATLVVSVGGEVVGTGSVCPLAMAAMAIKMGTRIMAIPVCLACTQYIPVQGPPSTISSIEVRTPQ